MKERKGFVSNSSSSSFIVAFPVKPVAVEEVRKMLFTDYQEVVEMYDYSVTCDEIAEQVWADINNKELPTKEEIYGHFQNLYWHYGYVCSRKNIHDILDYDDRFILKNDTLRRKYLDTFEEKENLDKGSFWNNEDEEKKKAHWAKYHELNDKLSEIAAECFEYDYAELMKEWKDMYIRTFCYSDNDGQKFCVMEHGDIFSNVKSIRINQH